MGGNHMSWWRQVPYFRDRYTVVTFAHRGWAPSLGAPDVARFPEDLEALVDHLGLGEVRLVGQSMGGWANVGFSLRHPDRVKALVMSSTIGTLRLRAELDAAINDKVAADKLQATGIHPAAGERMAAEDSDLEYLYALIDRLSVGLDKRALRPPLYEMRTVPPKELRVLRAPQLWIIGEEDTVPPAVRAEVRRLFPDDWHEIIPAAGHSTYFQRPELWNPIVDRFLETTGGPPARARAATAAPIGR
jgi:3-oxoadipate enol-lactonase